MEKEEVIREVLMKCQNYGETYIVGGYIRNRLLGYEFNDVDLLTVCSPQRLKHLFPQLTWTELGISFGISRMNYKGIEFEFSSCLPEEIKEKLKVRDFTINSFYFDGENLISQFTGSKDIEDKVVRPTPYFDKNIENSPHSFIRAFRFVSMYNLKWSKELIDKLTQKITYFNQIPNGRLQSEAYEIIKGENFLRSLYYYSQLGLIDTDSNVEKYKDESVPLYNQNISARLIYFSYLVGKQNVISWIKLHNLSAKLIEDIQDYLPNMKNESIKVPPRKLPFVTLLKRYQYKDNKEKIKRFLEKNK